MGNVFTSYGFYSLLEISIVVGGIVILFNLLCPCMEWNPRDALNADEARRLAERARENCIIEETRLKELRTCAPAEVEKSRVRKAVEAERKAVEAEMSRIAAELISKIDYFIRTRNRFDSRYPLAYRCALGSINQDGDVRAILQALATYNNISLMDFIRQQRSFMCYEDSSNAQVSVKYKTPFQGQIRVYGYFRCGNCDRRWESGSTWRDKWQKCQGCESECYPYAQRILHQKEVTEGKDDRKPHHMDRCQKCIESGRLCVPSMYFAV